VDFPSADHTAHTTMIECSNMGHCDKTSGLCTCRDGFYGSACQYSQCIKSNATAGEACHGTGRCMTLHEAAQEQNHVTLMHSATYNLWDAHKIQGCICDPGWTGADCSLRSCPYGDDPGSAGQVDEVQVIDCKATGGTFTITFRGETTAAIAFGANAGAIDAALEALATIDYVTTTIEDSNSAACDGDGNTIKVVFTHHAGDLPPMVLTSSLTGPDNAVTLRENGATSSYGSNVASVRGTREWVECSKRGLCDRSTGVCACHTDYESSDGSVAVDEVQIIDCLATGGTFTIGFDGATTSNIAFNADKVAIELALEALSTIEKSVSVDIADAQTVACDGDGNTILVTFKASWGDIDALTLTGSSLTGGGSSLTLKENGATSLYGTNVASVRGSGLGYRGDCGMLVRQTGAVGIYDLDATTHACAQIKFLTAATPDMECGGHGTCSGGTYCSACDSGYTEDCTVKTCPSARAWFQEPTATNTAHATTECGGVGFCDRETGICACGSIGSFSFSSNSVFNGAACGAMSCPYNTTGGTTCGGKGICLNMQSWGAKVTDGHGTVTSYDYNQGATTGSWDFQTITGCFCDYNPEQNRPYASLMYTGPQSWGSYPLRGFDCTKHACATGDNPDTYEQEFEVQQMTCKATSGTFTLTFRGFTTEPISYNAVAMIADEDALSSAAGTGKGESVQQKLHDIFSIHPQCFKGSCIGLTVSYSNGSAACHSTGSNVASVTFKSELGDLPVLTAVVTDLVHSSGSSVTVVESVRGTRETQPCSDHGICDEDTGSCLCHRGYSSSNGDGGPGPLGDCGWPTMFAKTDKAFRRYSGDLRSLITQRTSFVANSDAQF
jgi:hypothetical protein